MFGTALHSSGVVGLLSLNSAPLCVKLFLHAAVHMRRMTVNRTGLKLTAAAGNGEQINMRMRKKKNLESRLEACKGVLTVAQSEELNYEAENTGDRILNLAELFGNDRPVHLEIGCGKGQFAAQAAKRNPEINFLAVEKCANVIVSACEKAIAEEIPNLKFIKCGAEYLPRFLAENSISRIYLNFSCPFPKKSYASHRLTSPRFLKIYEGLLTPEGVICQKTDNMHFFEYSIEQFSNYGYTLQNISLDLHASDFEGNIVTEYEQRFSEQGCPIYRLEAFLKQKN